jgi:hypothetical protein
MILFLILFTNCCAQQSFDTTGRAFTQLYGVTLEETTIEKAQSLLGSTKEYRDGDAALSSHRINYFIKKDNLYITFDAGEMGGGKRITSFRLSITPLKEKYTTNTKVFLSKTDLFGIRLGMSKYKFFKMFPNQYIMDTSKQEYSKMDFLDRKKPDRFIYFYNKMPMKKKDIEYFHIENLQDAFYGESIDMIPTFKRDSLVKLDIGKTTSY